jgi:hypothetical protein
MTEQKKASAAIALALLILSTSGLLLVDLANANPVATIGYPQISINRDGSITPPTAPINHTGNIYTLTEDLLEQTVVIGRDDIVFDGAGHIINVPKKAGSGLSVYATVGLRLSPDENAEGVTYRKNVTIRNVTVLGSIEIYCGDNCRIEKVNANIWIEGSSNTIKDSACGLLGLSNNAQSNLITKNNINELFIGRDCYSTKFYLNSFNLTKYPLILTSISWDNGAQGNFWSNYTLKYPDASEIGNTGIGDTPYIIERDEYSTKEYPDVKNVDNYPLMYPWGAPQVTLFNIGNLTSSEPFSLNFSINKPTVWTGYSLDGQGNVTVSGNVTLEELPSGLHNVTVCAKDVFGYVGVSETIFFTIVEPEPFPTALVATASATSAAVIGAGLLVYFKKRKH